MLKRDESEMGVSSEISREEEELDNSEGLEVGEYQR